LGSISITDKLSLESILPRSGGRLGG